MWQWSNDYDDPDHWERGQVPCPGERVNIGAEIVMMPASGALGNIDLAVG